MNAEQTVHATAEELRELLSEAEDVLAGAGGSADKKVRDLRNRMRAALEQGESHYREARQAARNHLQNYDEYIHLHPYQALGAAMAVGVVAGLLAGRRT